MFLFRNSLIYLHYDMYTIIFVINSFVKKKKKVFNKFVYGHVSNGHRESILLYAFQTRLCFKNRCFSNCTRAGRTRLLQGFFFFCNPILLDTRSYFIVVLFPNRRNVRFSHRFFDRACEGVVRNDYRSE